MASLCARCVARHPAALVRSGAWASRRTNTTMQLWATTELCKPFELIERPIPKLKGTEVLVKNVYSGVCHSEVHLKENGGAWTDDMPVNKTPFVLGHEMEGDVVAVGPGVTDDMIKMGDRYVVFPWLGCGTAPQPCTMCSMGNEIMCLRGNPAFFADGRTLYGGYGSHAVVPHPRYLLPAPSNIPAGVACIYICSGLTAYGALKKIGKPPNGGGDLLIVGCGGLGLQAIQFAKAMHGTPPRAMDRSPAARAAAEAMGCVTYEPTEEGIAKLKSDTDAGVFGAIDFVGNTATSIFGANCVRRTGQLVMVGLAGGGFLNIPLQGYPFRGITVKGSLTGTLSEANEMFDIIKSGAITTIPHHFRHVSEVNAVHHELENVKYVGRTILTHEKK